MRRRGNDRTAIEQQPHATDESDVAVALVRTSFLMVLAVKMGVQTTIVAPSLFAVFLIRVMPPMAGIFTAVLFASYLWRFPLRFRRPIALAMDLLLVAAAMAGLPPTTPPVYYQWLMALYYMIIMVGAIWYHRPGAVITAIAASVLDVLFRLQIDASWLVESGSDQLPFVWVLISQGQAVPMLMVGVAVSYIVIARDREHRRAMRMHRDMTMARRLQRNILPKTVPSVPGYDLAVEFRPAHVVGGDFYDIVGGRDGRLFVCIGDMPGKSVYGLVHLSLLHSHLRTAIREGLGPQEVAEFVNSRTYEPLQPNLYAPMFIGLLDVAEDTLTFVNCGHLPPLLLREGNSDDCMELKTGDIVIGATRTPDYSEESVSLDRGDTIVCYTDGIVEARSRRGEEFGIARMCDVIDDSTESDMSAIAREIREAADAFGVRAHLDDRTVLLMKRR